MPDYKKVFASASTLNPYEWSDSNYLKGWDMVGSNPPTKQQFDALFRNIDEKENYLYSQIFNGTRLRRNGTNYAVGDRVYYTAMPTYLELECVTAGTTATAEVDVPAGIKAGDTLTDGTVIWKAIKYAIDEDLKSYVTDTANRFLADVTAKGNVLTFSRGDGTSKNVAIDAVLDISTANADITVQTASSKKTYTINNVAHATAADVDSSGKRIDGYIRGASKSGDNIVLTTGAGKTAASIKLTSMLDVYPVGSIYMSVNNVNPSQLFGGRWEQIQGRFLLAAGGGYAAGTTGGASSQPVSMSVNVPNHWHYFGTENNNNGRFGIAKSKVSAISHSNWGGYVVWNGHNGHQGTDVNAPVSALTDIDPRSLVTDGAHGSATATASTNINTMPPYLAVYVWRRTA